MEQRRFIESFTDLDDAQLWMSSVIVDQAVFGEVQEGTQLVYTNHQWRVGVIIDAYPQGEAKI